MTIFYVILIVSFVVYLILHFSRPKQVIEKENTDVEYNYNTFEKELLIEVNKHRASLGLSQLILNNYLSSKCLEHNQYMTEKEKASHDYFNLRENEIINSLDLKYVGENLAYNFTTAKSTLDAWLNSKEHKLNLENPKWVIMGVSNFNKYTTNIFAG